MNEAFSELFRRGEKPFWRGAPSVQSEHDRCTQSAGDWSGQDHTQRSPGFFSDLHGPAMVRNSEPVSKLEARECWATMHAWVFDASSLGSSESHCWGSRSRRRSLPQK